jgi:small subunit ribosomal protein S8
MSRNFLFADFIAHVKNCLNARLKFASFPHSKLIEKVCEILLADGFILSFDNTVNERGLKFINVKLSYFNSTSVIKEINLISKPSRRVYKKINEIKPFKNGFGLLILSTSNGIMSYRDALKQKVGGEVLCSVF